MRMSLFCLLFRMDQAHEAVKGTAESINPFVSGPSGLNRSDHVSTEALVTFS